jgi:hypothetical protein
MVATKANSVKKPDQLTVSRKLNNGDTVRRQFEKYPPTGSAQR